MRKSGEFAEQKAGHFYLCEGGTETEIMYKHGFDFSHFAVFELLENPKAVAALEAMYRKYFEVVAKHEMSALVGGLDYRASPDWGALLGYSTQGLADKNLECIEFLRRIGSEYAADINAILLRVWLVLVGMHMRLTGPSRKMRRRIIIPCNCRL